MVIGITGPAGSGKSYVLSLLSEQLGIPVIDSDSTTKELYVPGSETLSEIRTAFGAEAILSDGNLNKPFISNLVFHDEAALKRLNAIAHPKTIALIHEKISRFRENGHDIIFVESALAERADYRKQLCDELWLVYASEQTRRERLRASRNYSDDRIDAVFSSQDTVNSYLRSADRIILNDTGTTDAEILHQGRILLDVCRIGSFML